MPKSTHVDPTDRRRERWTTIEELRTGAPAELERVLTTGNPRNVLVSDLSLGAWRSDHVAREICAQLRLEPGPAEWTVDDSAQDRGTADVIGDLVDSEMAGNLVARRAVTLAEAVCEALTPHTLIAVIAPRFGCAWEEADVRFVKELAALFPTHRARIVIFTVPDTTGAPVTGLHSLVPGVASPEIAAAISAREGPSDVSLLGLENGFELVAPACRRGPESVPKTRFADLAVVAQACRAPWLSAYAQCHGYGLLADGAWLRDQAIWRSAQGSVNLALRLAERAADCGRDVADRLAGESVLQGMRIGAQRFAQAAEHRDPPPGAPVPQRAFLLETKGWGLTMIRKSSEAERYLEEARAITDTSVGDERDRLYLLNISALNRLRLGDADGALAMEREIEDRHAVLARRDWRLEYLNTLNIARLLRQLGRLAEALPYFERAFSTTLGVRSPSEAIHTNVTRARLADESGDGTAAFEDFLRATVHWLALDVPESIAARAERTVTGANAPAGIDQVEGVSAALLAALLDHAPRVWRDELTEAAGSGSHEPLSFVYASDLLPTAEMGWASMGPGFGLLTAVCASSRPPRSEPPGRIALRATATTAIEHALGDLRGATVVIDERLGRELPRTPTELLESSLRLHCPGLAHGDRRLRLDERLRSTLGGSLRVTLGDAVDRVETDGPGRARVLFKRRLAPAPLAAREARLLTLIEDEPTIEELRKRSSISGLRAALRDLEARRILALRVTPDSRATASIGLLAGTAP